MPGLYILLIRKSTVSDTGIQRETQCYDDVSVDFTFFFLTVDFPFHRFKARCFFFTQRVTVLKKIWQTYGYITMSQGELEVGSVCLLLTPTLAMQFTADFKLGQ